MQISHVLSRIALSRNRAQALRQQRSPLSYLTAPKYLILLIYSTAIFSLVHGTLYTEIFFLSFVYICSDYLSDLIRFVIIFSDL